MRKKREAAGLMQYEVAKTMRLGQSQLCELEAGRRHWSDEQLQRYEDALTVLAAEGGGR